MTWVRLDDRFPSHPKVLGLSDGAFRVHVSAICYAAEYETNGVISSVLVRQNKWQRRIKELVEARLWDPVDGGFVIHDYLEYNPSREQVTATREATRQRQQRFRRREGNAVTNASVTLSRNADPGPTRPDPVPITPCSPPEPKTFTQRLWQVHEELSGRITPPKPLDEHQFEEWERLGCTLEMVEEARSDTLAWGPERPWAAFKAKLGELVARPRLRAGDAPVTLSAEQVAALRGEA